MKYKRPLLTSLDGVDDEFMLTTNDLASVLNCDNGLARELLTTGKIPGAIRLGKLIRISAGDVRAFLKSERLPKNAHIAAARAASRGRAGGSL